VQAMDLVDFLLIKNGARRRDIWGDVDIDVAKIDTTEHGSWAEKIIGIHVNIGIGRCNRRHIVDEFIRWGIAKGQYRPCWWR
jgi:hypothetical protein